MSDYRLLVLELMVTYYDRLSRVGEGAVNNVSVTSYPADVGSTPVDVTRMVVKNILKSSSCIHKVPSCRMEDALRFAS